jgi:hypothetical protein
LTSLALNSGCSKQESPQAGTATPAGKPSAISVTPQSGSGAAQTFKVKFSSAGGYKQLADVRLLINAEANGGSACYVYYDLNSNSFLLINDAGTGSTGAVLGTGTSTENSQCSVSTLGASAVGNGDELTVDMPIKFKPGYAGQKRLIMFAEGQNGQNTDLVSKGEWTVTSK